jgi:hypothetical protein
LSDPVRQLKNGNEYRIMLKQQTVWCFAGSREELFGGRNDVPVEGLPEGLIVRLLAW